MSFDTALTSFVDLAKAFGLLKAVFVAFFGYHVWKTGKLHKQSLDAKQGEIERLVDELRPKREAAVAPVRNKRRNKK